MCFRAMTWAIELPLPTDAKMLMMHYAERADAKRDYWLWSGVRDIERRTGLRRPRIALLNQCFAEAGLLTIHPGNARKATCYRVHVGAKLAAPLKIPAQRRGRKWSELVPQPAVGEVQRPPAIMQGAPCKSAGEEGLFRERCGAYVRPAAVHTCDPQPVLKPVLEPVLPKCLRTSGASLRNAPRDDDGVDVGTWPTSKMIGYARRLGLDPAQVFERIGIEAGELEMPWPPDDGADWASRWYATCEAEAAGYTGTVSAGMEEICWRAEHPEDCLDEQAAADRLPARPALSEPDNDALWTPPWLKEATGST